MTLHWWMHWFWVTLLMALACSGPSLSAPQSEEVLHISSSETATRFAERQGRAMYFSKPVSTSTRPFIINITDADSHELPKSPSTPDLPKPQTTDSSEKVLGIDTPLEDQDPLGVPLDIPASIKLLEDLTKLYNSTNNETSTDIVHPGILWTPVNSSVTPSTTETVAKSTETTTTVDIEATESTKPPNEIDINTTVAKKQNSTQSDLVKDEGVEGASESRIVTEKPLSLETSYLQTRTQQPSNPSVEPYRRVVEGGLRMDTGAIAGISFGALVLAALVGSTGFVLYRRRYLNKPQTLNDKCSNPDSSGYLDDSTVRDNSEEMYSLDNDSFLNSLEAMTIQNYWTDTVKHTKL